MRTNGCQATARDVCSLRGGKPGVTLAPMTAVSLGLKTLSRVANRVCRQLWTKRVVNQGWDLSRGSSQDTGPIADLDIDIAIL